MTTKPRLLCVDDEPEILNSIKANLRKVYAVTTASSGAEALSLFETADGSVPFDAVMSDMRMPQMNGAQLLTELRNRHPEVPRLLLSGQSDVDSAIAAINDAKIFRFLTKPCSRELIIESVDEALEQARLRNVERELLDQTLSGTVSLLTDVLGLVSAGAYSRTMRLKETVHGICEALDRPVPWDLNLATMLSQIGFVVLPTDTGDGSGAADRHVEIAGDLLGNVARMETVADIVRHQVASKPRVRSEDLDDWTEPNLHCEILRVAVHFDALVASGRSRTDAGKALATCEGRSPGFLIDALSKVEAGEESMVEISTSVDRLAAGMQLTADLQLANGSKLAGAGTTLTSVLIGRIRAFAFSSGVIEPVHVLAPESSVSKAVAR